MQRELLPINEFIKSQMSIYSDIHGNLSIRALSKEVDISHGHLSEILRGKYALKRNQATKILDFLETPAAIRDKYVGLLSVDGNIKSEYDRVVDEIVEIDFELTLVDHTVYSIFCCTEFNGCFDELIDRSGLSRSEVLTCINKLEVYNILRRDVRGNLYAPHVKIMATVKEKTLAKVESLKTRKKIMENAIEVLDFGIYGGGHCNRPCYMPYRFASIPKSKLLKSSSVSSTGTDSKQ